MKKFKFIFLLHFFIFSTAILMAQEDSKTPKRLTNARRPAKVSKYKLTQFNGRWQEISRVKISNNETVNIDDTLFIRFYDSAKADTKQGGSVVITGTVELSGEDEISTSANDFKVLSVSEKELVLDDYYGNVRKLEKKDIFWYETEKPVPVAEPDTVKNIIDISPVSLNKNWFVYRRGANPGFIKPETPLIRDLLIKEKTGENVYSGEIEFSVKGQAVTQPCTLTFDNYSLVISAIANTWNAEIYKADGKELVFGKKGELVYYFKPQ